MKIQASYPTEQHEKAAEVIFDFFSEKLIETVMLFGSCARGKASKDSCLDIMVLIRPDIRSVFIKTAYRKNGMNSMQGRISLKRC